MTADTKPAAEDGMAVVIVDDHGLLAQSLAFALKADGFRVEHCADLTEDGILEAVDTVAPEVVLLDLDLGGDLGTALPVIPAVTARGATVVILTGVTDRVRQAECIEAGASGVIAKSQPFDELVDGVRRAAKTGTLLAHDQRQAYLADLRQQRVEDERRRRVFDQLTPREAQVLSALMDGWSAEQIATNWVVSMATVRTQIRTLLQKLGVNSQLSAVALARKSDWRPGNEHLR